MGDGFNTYSHILPEWFCFTDGRSSIATIDCWKLPHVFNFTLVSSYIHVQAGVSQTEKHTVVVVWSGERTATKMAIWQRQMETSLYGELLITSSGLILHFLARLDYIHPNKVNLANISAILLQACSINYQEDSRYEGMDQKITTVVFTSCSAGCPSCQ